MHGPAGTPPFPRTATESGWRGSAASAPCPHAGNEGTSFTRPPASPGNGGTRRHAPRAFPLPPRHPRGASETKKTHPPNPRQSRELNPGQARGPPRQAWGRGGGGAGGTHRGHEAARPAADTIWQRGDVSGSSCSLRSGGGTALPLPMATASKHGPPAAAASFPAAFPRSRPPPPPAPPLAPPGPCGLRAAAGSASRLGKVALSPQKYQLNTKFKKKIKIEVHKPSF